MSALSAVARPGPVTSIELDELDELPIKVQGWIKSALCDPVVIAGLAGFGNLRPYQFEAVLAAAHRVRKTIEPILITLPTGAGKSWVIAALASVVQSMSNANAEKPKKVLVLAHSSELVSQNHSKMVQAGYNATIYSAGLQQRDASGDIVFGSRQTIVNAVDEFAELGYEFSAVFIDEAHSTPKQTRDIVDALRRANPNLRVIGLTATPYSLGNGYIYARDSFRDLPELREVFTKNPYFAELVYDKCVHELIAKGYLCPPTMGIISDHYNTEALERTVGGSFSEASNNAVFVTGQENLTKRIVAEVVDKAVNRHGVMFFGQNREHARQILSLLPQEQSDLVDSGTKPKDRDQIIRDFKEGKLKYLVTVAALAIGFDAPCVELIAVLRHTESPAFFQQIIGRGLRLCPEIGKRDCLILDYASNLPPDGDLFTPAIQLGVPRDGVLIPMVEVSCPSCQGDNTFRKARWTEDVDMTDTGFLFHKDDLSLLLDSQKKPLAGHLGVQCTNMLEQGKDEPLVRCGYTWGAVRCPRCERRNSHRVDFCVACEQPLSKRAKLLTMTKSRDENYAERLVRVNSRAREWMVAGKAKTSGAPNLRLSLTVQELPYLVPEETLNRKKITKPSEDDDKREAWLPPGMVVVRPEPFRLVAWLNPSAKNPAAQASWESFKSYAQENQFKRVGWGAYPQMEELLDKLATPDSDLNFRAPAYLVYQRNAVRDSDRVFYNLVGFHREHPDSVVVGDDLLRDEVK